MPAGSAAPGSTASAARPGSPRVARTWARTRVATASSPSRRTVPARSQSSSPAAIVAAKRYRIRIDSGGALSGTHRMRVEGQSCAKTTLMRKPSGSFASRAALRVSRHMSPAGLPAACSRGCGTRAATSGPLISRRLRPARSPGRWCRRGCRTRGTPESDFGLWEPNLLVRAGRQQRIGE
jgi:hypothetical protein